MGRVVINQTEEKLVIILETAPDAVNGTYTDGDGVEHSVGGIEYKLYKPKEKTVATAQNTGMSVLGTIENYRGWGPTPVTGLFLNQNNAGLGTSAGIVQNGTNGTAYITEQSTGAFSANMNDSVRFRLYIPEGHEEDVATFLEEVTE